MEPLNSDIISQHVSYFKGVLDSDCTNTGSIKAILKGIKEGKWKQEIEWYRQEEDKEERDKIKKMFPGCTFSGAFKNRRLDKNIDYYTGILVIDIDEKDLTMSFDKTMTYLKECPFIFCVFTSTGGAGMKALVYNTFTNIDHKLFFSGVEEYLFDEYGIKMDPSGKNVGRLCFISYDPELYLQFKNKRSFQLDVDAPKTLLTEESRKFDEAKTIDYNAYEASHDVRYIFEVAKKYAEKGMGSYRKGNRNNYVFYLSCILNRAGIRLDLAVDVISNTYVSLDHSEILSAVNSAYSHNASEHGSKLIYVKKSNQNNII